MRKIVQRVIAAALTLTFLAAVTFALGTMLPGDPAARALGERTAANPEAVAAYRERWGLDEPIHLQFATYVSNLLHGDFGRSSTTQRAVLEDLKEFLPATLELVVAAALIGVPLTLVFGVVGARYRRRWPDGVVRVCSSLIASIPSFWLSILGLQLLYVWLGVLPGPVGRLPIGVEPPERVTGSYVLDAAIAGDWSTAWAALEHLVLPALVLALPFAALLARVLRSSMVEVLESPMTTALNAKGLSTAKILVRHQVPNALIPVVTVGGIAFAGLLTGAVLVETVFGMQGMGRYLADAARASDLQAVMGVTLVNGVVFIIVNTLVDLSYVRLDPRIRT